MKRRFIIVINDATAEQQNAVSIFLKNIGIAYWHWLSDMWLVIDQTNTWNAANLRDKMNELVPANHKYVSEIANSTGWAAFGNKETFSWLHKDWSE